MPEIPPINSLDMKDWRYTFYRIAGGIQALAIVLGLGIWVMVIALPISLNLVQVTGMIANTALMVVSFIFATRARRLANADKAGKPLLISVIALVLGPVISYLVLLGSGMAG